MRRKLSLEYNPMTGVVSVRKGEQTYASIHWEDGRDVVITYKNCTEDIILEAVKIAEDREWDRAYEALLGCL